MSSPAVLPSVRRPRRPTFLHALVASEPLFLHLPPTAREIIISRRRFYSPDAVGKDESSSSKLYPLNHLARFQNLREEKLVVPPGMEDRLARLQYLRQQKLHPLNYLARFQNVREAELVDPPEIKDRLAGLQSLRQGKLVVQGKKPAVEERIFLKLDEVNRMFDRREILLKELKEVVTDRIERERRRRILFRASMVIGLAIYVQQHFFGSRQEDDQKQLNPVS